MPYIVKHIYRKRYPNFSIGIMLAPLEEKNEK